MIKILLIIGGIILYLIIGLITVYVVSYLDTRFNIPFTDGVDYDECIGIGFIWPLAYPVLAILYIAHLYICVAKAVFERGGRIRRK